MSTSEDRHWERLPILLIGILGVVGVAAGAFGAHALGGFLERTGRTHAWETAVFYNLVHASVSLAAALLAGARFRMAVWFWLVGVTLFSGSLYCLALGGPKWLGPVTPFGGMFLILGWLMIAIKAVVRGRKEVD